MLSCGDEPWKKSSHYSGRLPLEAHNQCSDEAWLQADRFTEAWVNYAGRNENGFDQLVVLDIYAQMALFDPAERVRLDRICADIDTLVANKRCFPHAQAEVSAKQQKTRVDSRKSLGDWLKMAAVKHVGEYATQIAETNKEELFQEPINITVTASKKRRVCLEDDSDDDILDEQLMAAPEDASVE